MGPVVLTCHGEGEGPRFTRAEFLPERGLMLARLTAALPGRGAFDLVSDHPRADDDAHGNASFSFGGAFLIPFANRITGRDLGDGMIETQIGEHTFHLPANWGGKAEGAPRYAMHGLILNREVEVTERTHDRLRAHLHAGDFSGCWPSSTELTFKIGLDADQLSIDIAAENVGREPLPMGIGWHPWLSLPSGVRAQARLHVPAKRRVEVDDYDSVLPTGRLCDVAGGDYDLRAPEGRPLGQAYLDDCFIDLDPGDGAAARLSDPAAAVVVTLEAESPARTIQVYAPTDRPVIVIEPQFNRADPFGQVWDAGADTGMVWLQPGERTHYRVNLRLGV